jgi:hypothetical protein
MKLVVFVLPFGRSRKSLLPLLLLLTLPAVVQAQFSCATNNGTITITGYTGPGGDVTIPATITGLPVTSIGDNAFYACFDLTTITIPDSVTSIGGWAFRDCYSLTSVTIPDSVTNIAVWAFADCSSLTSITIPNSVSGIGICAFDGCTSLTSVTIPDSFTDIAHWAFADCSSLTSVTIPNSVSSIGYCAFDGCTSLTSVAIPDSVTSIGQRAFADCSSLTSVAIPDSVSSIGYCAFEGCTSLMGVYFEGNAPTIGGSASDLFYGDNNATVYYMPGTTGWGSTFGGRPTVLWNPEPQSIGVQANSFGFTITGTTNIPIVVETCTNLASASWTPLQTCTLTNGSIYFSDSRWTNYTRRFYRIRSP